MKVKSYIARLLILSVVSGWTAQVVADDSVYDICRAPAGALQISVYDSEKSSSIPRLQFSHARATFEFASPLLKVKPASFPMKLLWAGTTLLNPTGQNKPIPLYGYYIMDIEEKELNRLLSLSEEDQARIALLWEDSKDVVYGRGIQIDIKNNGSYGPYGSYTSYASEDFKQKFKVELEEKWIEFCKNELADINSAECSLDKAIIALTKPLDNISGGFNINEDAWNTINAQEFVTWPALWKNNNSIDKSAREKVP